MNPFITDSGKYWKCRDCRCPVATTDMPASDVDVRWIGHKAVCVARRPAPQDPVLPMWEDPASRYSWVVIAGLLAALAVIAVTVGIAVFAT